MVKRQTTDASTNSSVPNGEQESIAVKSSARGATRSSRPKATRANDVLDAVSPSSKPQPADQISDTTTPIELSTADPNIPVATEQPQPTESNDRNDEVSQDHSSQSGGLDDFGSAVRVISIANISPVTQVAFVVMPIELAMEMTKTGGAPASIAVTNVMADIDRIRQSDASLADSGIAASAFAMALELENPYNSATSKSMCARALMDALNRLRELCPPEQKADGLDDLAARRSARLDGDPVSAD